MDMKCHRKLRHLLEMVSHEILINPIGKISNSDSIKQSFKRFLTDIINEMVENNIS